jgi:dolichol-phosphate mannosyltransferase
MSVSVIVPTYREADNLPLLVPRIAAALHALRRPGEILVIDDDSPDETQAVCARLARAHPLRLVTRRGERGLATAVLHGLRLAGGEVVVVLDADLSHPPEAIGALVAELERPPADFVLGSRYVAGASTDEGWGLFRRLNSLVATALARPITTARDPMAGFFAVHRSTVAAARPLDPVGYKIALELIVKCGCRHVREVPIHFADRVKGESKLNLREQINYLRHLARLYRFTLLAGRPPAPLPHTGDRGKAA